MDYKRKERNFLRKRRKKRSVIQGTKDIPRLSVFRSNKRIFAQLIDDVSGNTLMGVLSEKNNGKENKISLAQKCGERLAILAKKMEIKRAVFDRGGYKYHGRVKSFLEGVEKGGLVFSKRVSMEKDKI